MTLTDTHLKYFESKHFKLLPHQIKGINWLCNREYGYGNCGLLCDEPGLGKTIQISGLMYLHQLKFTLILVPISIINQWVEILQCVVPNHNIIIHHGNNRSKSIDEFKNKICSKPVVVISSLKLLINDSILHKNSWDRIVIDEIHEIRNRKSKIFKSVMNLKSKSRFGLTGTPIHNHINDLKSLYIYLFPSVTEVTNKDIEKLNSLLILRRKKADVEHLKLLSQNIKFHHYHVPFITNEERDIYKMIKDKVSYELQEVLEYEDMTISQKMIYIFELIIRLRQTSIHPSIAIACLKNKYKIDINFSGISTKFKHILDILEKQTTFQNTIIFCNFIEEMNMIKDFLKNNNIESLIYNGKMNRKQKQETLDQFSHPFSISCFYKNNLFPNELNKLIIQKMPKVLLMQIKSGAVGLNLQNFSNVIFTTPDWNPSNEIQAIARSHRIGQKFRVNIHQLILQDENHEFDTIDERILETQYKKRKLINKVLNEKDPIMAQLDISKINKMTITDYQNILM